MKVHKRYVRVLFYSFDNVLLIKLSHITAFYDFSVTNIFLRVAKLLFDELVVLMNLFV